MLFSKYFEELCVFNRDLHEVQSFCSILAEHSHSNFYYENEFGQTDANYTQPYRFNCIRFELGQREKKS